MKSVAVSFSTGKEVLSAYWGFLANGGLVIESEQGLREGDRVALDVTIRSSQVRYRLNGHVVRGSRVEMSLRDQAVIAFAPGEPHDLLLSAAWAETHNVPARHQTRFPLHVEIQYCPAQGETALFRGHLVNVSYGGCCLRATGLVGEAAPVLGVGDELVLFGAHPLKVTGMVRWRRGMEMGIQFDATMERATIDAFVSPFLSSSV